MNGKNAVHPFVHSSHQILVVPIPWSLMLSICPYPDSFLYSQNVRFALELETNDRRPAFRPLALPHIVNALPIGTDPIDVNRASSDFVCQVMWLSVQNEGDEGGPALVNFTTPWVGQMVSTP